MDKLLKFFIGIGIMYAKVLIICMNVIFLPDLKLSFFIFDSRLESKCNFSNFFFFFFWRGFYFRSSLVRDSKHKFNYSNGESMHIVQVINQI